MNRIIIIGNGFDLAHNLKTGYKDFINDYWAVVEEQVYGRYWQWLDQHYGGPNTSLKITKIILCVLKKSVVKLKPIKFVFHIMKIVLLENYVH